jgi:uncharacterized protein (DUF1697 family)
VKNPIIKYVAFLRAINVGGRVIKMEELRKLFESLKLKNVKTYIQSGNVIFETAEKKKDILTKKIEKKLEVSLGYEVLVMLRKNKELENIVKNNPFKEEKLDENTRVYVAFLYNKPGKEIKSLIPSFNNKNEAFHLNGNEVYCKVHKDEKKHSYFSILLLEKKLGTPLTTRNQTTLNKIRTLFD